MEPTNPHSRNQIDAHSPEANLQPPVFNRVNPLVHSSLRPAAGAHEECCSSVLSNVWSVISSIGSCFLSILEWIWNCCTCADEPKDPKVSNRIAQMQAQMSAQAEQSLQETRQRTAELDRKTAQRRAQQEQDLETDKQRCQEMRAKIQQEAQESREAAAKRFQEAQQQRKQEYLELLQKAKEERLKVASKPPASQSAPLQPSPALPTSSMPSALPLPVPDHVGLQLHLDKLSQSFRQEMEQIALRDREAEAARQPQALIHRALIKGANNILPLLGDTFFKDAFKAQDTVVVLSSIWINRDLSTKTSLAVMVTPQTVEHSRAQIVSKFTEIMRGVQSSPTTINVETYLFYKLPEDIDTQNLHHRHRYFRHQRPANGGLFQEEGDEVAHDIDAEWITRNYFKGEVRLINLLITKLNKTFPGKHPLIGQEIATESF